MALSTTARAAVALPATDADFVVLMTLSHVDMAATIRLACDTQALVSNGETYEAAPFEFALPVSGEGVPRCEIGVSNVDSRMIEALLLIDSPIRVDLAVVLRAEPDTLIADYRRLELTETVATDTLVSGVLSARDYSGEPWPRTRATLDSLPGLYK
jgi:hypothetical protein